MYGPGCAVSDINTGAGVAAPSRRARTRVYVRARAALCAGFGPIYCRDTVGACYLRRSTFGRRFTVVIPSSYRCSPVSLSV